jgi:hypothetical protein
MWTDGRTYVTKLMDTFRDLSERALSRSCVCGQDIAPPVEDIANLWLSEINNIFVRF